MIIKIDIPDERCFKPLKRFVDSTFDFELVKMYDICSNQDISYMQILDLKPIEKNDYGVRIPDDGLPTSEMLENEWKNMMKSGKVEPLFGNIRQSDTSVIDVGKKETYPKWVNYPEPEANATENT